MGKPLSRPDCLRQNPACLGKGEEEDGYIEDCYVPQRSIYDTMRINEQIDQGCKLSQPSKSTMDRAEVATLSSNGTLGTSNACDAKAQETKKLDERVIFDALKLSNDTLKSAPVPPRRRPNADRKENVNRRSWKTFIPPNFPDFTERIEASLSEVSEAGTSSHSLHDKTEFSQLLPNSSKHPSCEQTESTSSQITTPAPSSAVSGNPSLDHNVDLRCHHVQSFDYYNDSEYEQDPLIAQENTSLCPRAKPGHNFPSATWPRALKSFIKGSLSDGHHRAVEMAYEECVIETLPLSPCLSDEVLDESSNLLIVPNLREKTESELKFEEDELKILMEAEEEWEDIDSGGACHAVTVCDNMLEERGLILFNEGSPDKTDYFSNLDSLPADTVTPDPSHWPENSNYICSSAVTRRYQKLGSYSDSESDADSDQLFLELEQQCLTGAADEHAKLHESVPDPEEEEEVNVESPSHVEPGNSHKTSQEVSEGPQLDMVQDHTYCKSNCIDSLTTETLIPDQTDIVCYGVKTSGVPHELIPLICTQQLIESGKNVDTNTCSAAESDSCHLRRSGEDVTIANTVIDETRTCGELPPLQVDEQCLTPYSNEVQGLSESSEQLDITFAYGTTELVLEGLEETPASIHVPHTESNSPLCDMERDSCLGSSEQPDESWTCEASFQGTDIISADVYEETSDGLELTVSTTTHGCSSLPDEMADDSLQSSTSASELQELPDDSGGKIEEMASGSQIKDILVELVVDNGISGGKIEEMATGSQIKDILFELAMDNGITDILSKSTTLQVINQNVTSPQTIEIIRSSEVVKFCDVTNESSVGVTIFTSSEEINGSIDTATISSVEEVHTELLVATDTQDSLTGDRSNKPETEDCAAQASNLSSEDLVDEQDFIFSGLNSLSLEVSTSHESKFKDDFTGSLSAQDLDGAQNFLIPGEIVEELYHLASSEVHSIAVLQKVTVSCSEIDMSPEANDDYSKSSEIVPDSSPIELDLNSRMQSSENDCKDTVSSRQALEEKCESPEPSSSDSEFELASEELDARVHLSDLSDSCSLSVNTRDNSLASWEEGGACVGSQSAGDTSEQCAGDPMVLSSTTEVFQKEQVDSLQVRLQQVNGLGQGLIQSADKNCDVHGLEHDAEELNAKWNTLNKKVAERVTQLQEALLHCGKFQDALEPLLSWLTDTEDLIANQKPPSAEYKVVKAQIQEQKLLQRLLDDRRSTVDMIQAEGTRIAEGADPADGEKINRQLETLKERWSSLLQKAQSRQKQLDDILVLAKQFHETTEPIFDWLSATEKKLANSEPIGTQTGKIQQQILRHKSLEDDVAVHKTDVCQADRLVDSLSALCCATERNRLAQKLDFLHAQYKEVQDLCSRKSALLGQALSNARLFGEDEVEVLNWLADLEDKLSCVSIKDYKLEVLQTQHKTQMALSEEISNRKRNVDQAVKNGQALLKQTTGEEVLLIQEKLDGIKTRYSEITASSGKALRTLEQALQLASKFQTTHEELTSWLERVEDELAHTSGQSIAGDQIPQFQQRQKELKKEAMEYRIVLDTINEVGSALLELVPWRAREGLDKLVSDANEQYRSVSATIGHRVDQIDAAIQRSQQYEQAADTELAWVAETRRKLLALGPVCLEQDQTTAQLQVQKAFSVDIIRHKDSIDELIGSQEEILGTCGDEQKATLQEKTKLLLQQYEDVSHINSERSARLERAQVLVGQFWETYEELNPWIEEMKTTISQLPTPAVDHEMLKQQQEEIRQLRESVSEHKPHIDKLLKIGPHLCDLNPEEGAAVQEKYSKAEELYLGIKEDVRKMAMALDDALAQAAQFHDKVGPMLETLESMASRLHLPPSIPAEVEKIRDCISDNKNTLMELEKLLPSFKALKHRGEELLSRSQGADTDPAAKAIQDKLDRLTFFWEDIKTKADEREMKLLDVLELAEKFWLDMNALLTTIKDTHEIVYDLESPGIDPSMIKQQIEAADSIKEETDGLHEELEFIRILGADLIFACGETEKPEVKKSIDEMNSAWETLKKTWTERLEKLRDAMSHAVQYQDTLQAMFDWLDNAVIKLCDMSPVGTDINTVKDQINEMKEFKVEVYQQQIEMEKLNHQGELMLKKAIDDTDREIIQGPITELKHLWENLGEKITHRQHKLEGALLALGQFQHALAEVMSWLTHTNELLDAQKPISGDPKVIEVELAKHHVLKNDVLSHESTVQTVNKAGSELLESSAGDDANSLRSRLQMLNQMWESILQKTEEREQQLDMALQQAQGFTGEIEDFIQWQSRIDSQLSAAKPTGGLPETAREQLQAHMELFAEVKANEELYKQLLDKGQLMLLSRDDSAGSVTEQNVALMKRKWQNINNKVDERKAKLEDALILATDFQNSLQDFINWLTQAEQSLNIAPAPSLILDTVLFQIDEHKVISCTI